MLKYSDKFRKAVKEVIEELETLTNEELDKEIDKYKDDPRTLAIAYGLDYKLDGKIHIN